MVWQEIAHLKIGAEDATIQSITNPEIAALVRDGSYLYVDSHFVLNHPKYFVIVACYQKAYF